jgi:hypothetical protein
VLDKTAKVFSGTRAERALEMWEASRARERCQQTEGLGGLSFGLLNIEGCDYVTLLKDCGRYPHCFPGMYRFLLLYFMQFLD